MKSTQAVMLGVAVRDITGFILGMGPPKSLIEVSRDFPRFCYKIVLVH
jgi:hypothetical protein